MSGGETEWGVEASPDHPVFTHIVGFSDWIAHEREDLVARAAEFLGRVAGIDRAVHEDREVIGLVAPALTTEQMAGIFEPWWGEARRSDPPWEEALKQLSSAAHTVLKPAGFKKRKHTFNRQASADVWHVIELRRLDDDTARIDIGIYIDGVDVRRGLAEKRRTWISEVICHIRDPLGGRHIIGLQAEPGSVADLLAGEILPRLEVLRSRPQLRAATDDGRRKLGMHRPANVVVATLAAMDGDRAVARTVLQQAFEDANRRARPGILAAGENMGLEPLTTGADKTLTVADEARLEAWVARQQDRLDELQRLVDANPVGGRLRKQARISTGRAALSALWRWLVRRAPDWGPSGAEPTMPARYAGTTFDVLSDEHKAMAELLTGLMFEIARREVPAVAWDYDQNGALAIRGRRTLPILGRGQQIISWLLDPPATVPSPEDANMLESRIDWLVAELGGG